MLTRREKAKAVEMLPGVVRRTLNVGERTLLVELTISKGFSVPPHSHPYEQVGYLVSGRLLSRFGEDEMEMHPGDSWLAPSNTVHGAIAMEDCVAVEVFSPPRDDYRD